MLSRHGVRASFRGDTGDCRRSLATHQANNRRLSGLALVVLFVLALIPGQIRAQGRGNLQVAAAVIQIQPSREALSLAVQPSNQARRSRLALISPVADSTALRPRAVVRIDFLRN